MGASNTAEPLRDHYNVLGKSLSHYLSLNEGFKYACTIAKLLFNIPFHLSDIIFFFLNTKTN